MREWEDATRGDAAMCLLYVMTRLDLLRTQKAPVIAPAEDAADREPVGASR